MDKQRWYSLLDALMMRPGMTQRAAPPVIEVHVYDGTTRQPMTRWHTADTGDTQHSVYQWATSLLRERLRCCCDPRATYWQITAYDRGVATVILTSNDSPPPTPRLYSYA